MPARKIRPKLARHPLPLFALRKAARPRGGGMLPLRGRWLSCAFPSRGDARIGGIEEIASSKYRGLFASAPFKPLAAGREGRAGSALVCENILWRLAEI